MSDAFQEPEKIHGEPPAASPADIEQQYPDTCAVRSQEIVLRDFGIFVSEDQLRAEAYQFGWYTPGFADQPGGSPADALGKLLELHGVPINRYENANIFNLQNELAQGHRVIIGVDSGELWHPGLNELYEDSHGDYGADHALIVSSIDTTDPENVKVVLTDPGTGQVAAVYSQEQFQDAWRDSNCIMVATAEPAPMSAPGMAHFDYAAGHLSHVGSMPYEHMHAFADLYEQEADVDSDALARINQIFNAAVHDYNALVCELGLDLDFEPAVHGSEHALAFGSAIRDHMWADEASRHPHVDLAETSFEAMQLQTDEEHVAGDSVMNEANNACLTSDEVDPFDHDPVDGHTC